MKEENFRLPDALAYRNIEAERSVLGAALQSQKALDRMKEMDINSFTDPGHRVLYAAIIETAAKGLAVDIVTMHTALSEQNKLDTIGGAGYLMGLINDVPTTANIGSYIRIVNECATRRHLKQIGEDLVRKSGYIDQNTDELREDAALQIRDVKSGSVKLVSQSEAIKITYEMLNANQTREGIEKSRIMTGIKPLDRMTGGLYGSKLMIIGARPSVGKSIFALTICMNAAKQGKRVLYITKEMEIEELMEREFASASMVNLREITSDEISTEGWKMLEESVGKLSQMQIFYYTEADTVEEVRKAAFEMYENGGIDLICIDYIQLLESSKKRSNRQEEVADISRSLKKLAQELKIPVIALSQLNRGSTKERRPPSMNDARESGAIEQDANIFLLLHDPDISEMKSDDLKRLHKNLGDKGMKLIYMNMDKNRQGRKGIFYVAFDGDHMRFLPVSMANPP